MPLASKPLPTGEPARSPPVSAGPRSGFRQPRAPLHQVGLPPGITSIRVDGAPPDGATPGEPATAWFDLPAGRPRVVELFGGPPSSHDSPQ